MVDHIKPLASLREALCGCQIPLNCSGILLPDDTGYHNTSESYGESRTVRIVYFTDECDRMSFSLLCGPPSKESADDCR